MPPLRGPEAVKEIRLRRPPAKISVLTVHDSEDFVFAALNNGAQEYALKEATPLELIQAINTVLAGKSTYAPAFREIC